MAFATSRSISISSAGVAGRSSFPMTRSGFPRADEGAEVDVALLRKRRSNASVVKRGDSITLPDVLYSFSIRSFTGAMDVPSPVTSS